MTFGSLFSGCGAMDLGLEWAGFECKWQVEINEFAREILGRHWPRVPKHGDISGISGGQLERVDLIAGGFPCQDLSCAGKQAGIDGSRSGLWAQFFRLIGDLRPRYVLIENVTGLLGNEPMRRVLGDLSSIGFDAEWKVLRASDFGAPHERERVFVLAYPNEKYGPEGMGTLENRQSPIFATGTPERSSFWIQASNLVARMGDGTPKKLYRPRRECIGNCVVPQIPHWIGRRIMEASA